MQETLEQLLSYLRGTWRHRWVLIITAWLVAVPGWIVVQKLPDQFAASARVYIDTDSLLKPLLQGIAVDINIRRRVELITKTLLSRPNLEKVVRMTDLDLKATNQLALDGLVEKIQAGVTLQGTGRENLYTISFAGSDANDAKRIVQSLLTILVESTLGEARKDTDSAQEFLDKQIADYERKLKEAEDKLASFKVENAGSMPGEGGDYYQRLQAAREQLTQAQLQLREVQRRRDSLRRQLSGEEPTFGILQQGPVNSFSSTIDVRLQALEVKLDELLLSYTEQHPDVLGIKRTIAKLEAQREKEREEFNKTLGDGDNASRPLEANPVYQQLKIAFSEAQASVASIQVRVDEYQRRVKDLQDSVDTIPKIEADLKRLNRDYQVNKNQYNQLLQRRESARISEDVDQTSDNIKFRVVDPPRVPAKPSGPNRSLFSTGVFIVSLGAGIFLAFLMSQIRPTFDSRRTLKDLTQIPVLGSVSMVWTDMEKNTRKKKLAVFMASCSVFFFAYLGVLGLSYFGIKPTVLAAVSFLSGGLS